MPRKPRCKYCNRVVNYTSKNRLCPACQIRKNKCVVRQMVKRKGKYYKRWKLNLLERMKNMPM